MNFSSNEDIEVSINKRKGLTFIALREMHIRTTLTCCLSQLIMAIIKNVKPNKPRKKVLARLW
jgi:hypothetical protein